MNSLPLLPALNVPPRSNSNRRLPFAASLTRRVCLLLAAACFGAGASASEAERRANVAEVTWTMLGKIKARSAAEIDGSNWSIGGETIDRDYTVYENYKKYLGPLGAKAIRIQTGWAKTEKERGVYAWDWLDAIVDDALAQGVRPWLEINYGNPIYPGGGETGLAGGLPSSPEALAAWDRWSRALVERYRDRVHEWEIWNEPDINSKGTAPVEAYIDLYLRTATMIRELQPQSQIWALGLAGKMDYADRFLSGMKAKGRLDLVDAITLHGYPRNPDDTSNVDQLRAIIAKHGRDIAVRQGETGAPSRYQEQFAMRNISWTENLQAKWNLRRMLAHRAKDVPFNLFTISDMHYTEYHRDTKKGVRMNYKGLLATNPDKTVSHAKQSYYAAQSVFSIFDGTLQRIAEYPFTTTALRSVALTGYQRSNDRGQVVALWFNDAPPSDANGATRVNVTLPAGRFTDPVLVDLLTSTVHALPAGCWTQEVAGAVFRDLPIYDAPVLLAERAAIEFVSAQP